jgi:hypothetical protein
LKTQLAQFERFGCNARDIFVLGVVGLQRVRPSKTTRSGRRTQAGKKAPEVTDAMKERFGSSAGSAAGLKLVAELVGSGLFRMSPRDVPASRRKPGPVPEGWSRTPASLLRYSDEQTVAGTAAVFSAMAAMGAAPGRFEGWGVVAASRYLGRANLASALRSFHAEGVWGTSPHLIPHFALHSPSGTISLALGLHGPNLGAGGGPYGVAEGALAALTWLAAGIVPGVWLVLTGWSPELIPTDRGAAPATSECQALALALTADVAQMGRPVLRVVAGGGSAPEGASVDLVSLAESLAMRGVPSPRTIATDPSGRLRVELVQGVREPGVTRHGQG